MTIKKVATCGSILAGIALSASAAWANCTVGKNTITQTLSCTTTRGNFTATAPSGANPSSSISVSLSTGTDLRSREARSSGFDANGTIRCTAIFTRLSGQAGSGSSGPIACSQPVVTHTLSLTASLFP